MNGETRIDAEAAALVAEIDREAEAEKELILTTAKEKAREILAAADARISAATEEASRLLEKTARVDEERLLGQARLSAEAERVRGLRQTYDEVFEIAQERIDALAGSPRYAEVMKALIGESLRMLPKAARMIVARGDEKLCRDTARALGVDCEVTAAELPRGSVVASTADGKVTADNSLGTRLLMARGAMETQIARCLDG